MLTENGDLYYINNKWELNLIDTNVVHCNFKIKGCYIKRSI